MIPINQIASKTDELLKVVNLEAEKDVICLNLINFI